MKIVLVCAYVCVCVFREPDSAVFNLQGDKGEAGASGRDVSVAKSVFYSYLFVSVCFDTELNLPYFTCSFLY